MRSAMAAQSQQSVAVSKAALKCAPSARLFILDRRHCWTDWTPTRNFVAISVLGEPAANHSATLSRIPRGTAGARPS